MSWSLFNLFGSPKDSELPEIFPMEFVRDNFVKIDVTNIYQRILIDVLERTDGIKEEHEALLWDNCLGSEKQEGLVTLLATAMTDKAELFLIYDQTTKVIRKADADEIVKIRADYKKDNESSVGVFITFKNYHKSDMIKFYSALEYCTVNGLWKSMNISKAVQMKFKNMRSSTNLGDSGEAKSQMVALAKALNEGKAIGMDGDDSVELGDPKMEATNSAMDFIVKKQAFYLGVSATYLTGEAPKGLGDSGQGDSKSNDRSLRPYFFSIIKPAIEDIFDYESKDLSFVEEDKESLTTASDLLESFDRTSNDHLSMENKTKIVNKAFGLDENQKGDEPEKVDPNAGGLNPDGTPKTSPPSGAKPNPALPPPKE